MCTVSRVKAALHTGLLATSRCTSPARSVGVLRLEPLCHCSFSIGMRHLHAVSILTAVSTFAMVETPTVLFIAAALACALRVLCVGLCLCFYRFEMGLLQTLLTSHRLHVACSMLHACCRRSLASTECMLHVDVARCRRSLASNGTFSCSRPALPRCYMRRSPLTARRHRCLRPHGCSESSLSSS
jgi:hypothetical protein